MSKRKKKAIQLARKKAVSIFRNMDRVEFFLPSGLAASFSIQKFGTSFNFPASCPKNVAWTNDEGDFIRRSSKFNSYESLKSAVDSLSSSGDDYVYSINGNETLVYYRNI